MPPRTGNTGDTGGTDASGAGEPYVIVYHAKLGFRLTKDEASDLLSNVDSNYDGEINYKEVKG